MQLNFTMWRRTFIRGTIRRLGFIFFLSFLVFSCSKNREQSVFLIIHQFQASYSRSLFESAVTNTADSLHVPIVLYSYDEFSKLPATKVDSILNITNAVSISCSDSSFVATLLQHKNKSAPLIGFDRRLSVPCATFIDTDSYTAGKQAGEYIRSKFGKTGTFAIITPSLENPASNECIRGFREKLGIAQNRWKQLNILTCNSPNYIISTQFRRLSAVEPQPIWLVAGPCDDFLSSIQEDKGDSYFISQMLEIDDPQALYHEMFDAVALKDYYHMGELVITSGLQLKSEETSILRSIDCGVQVKNIKELAR